MGWNDDDIYNDPEKFGLETVGSIDWSSDSYEFDITVVLRDPSTGQIFYAEDSGCSCPSPFEDYTSRESLTEVTGWAELNAHLQTRIPDVEEDGYYYGISRDDAVARVGELVQKVLVLR